MLNRIIVALLLAIFVTGCGKTDGEQQSSSGSRTSPRDYQGKGIPFRLFGSRELRGNPGADDREYQEYLLWKEWQQYQNYQKWLQSRNEEQQEPQPESGD